MILSDTRIFLKKLKKELLKSNRMTGSALAVILMMFIWANGSPNIKNTYWMQKNTMPIDYFEIPEEGFVLYPHVFYLGVTEEYTETHAHVPFLEGKSSTGRLGIDIHATAGKGDVGFCGNWTLEISVKQPVKIYKIHAYWTTDLFSGGRRN